MGDWTWTEWIWNGAAVIGLLALTYWVIKQLDKRGVWDKLRRRY